MITTLSPSLAVRGAILTALKADAALTAIVPAARIYPTKTPATPSWPFIRVPLLTGAPMQTDGSGGGADQSGVLHCFTKLNTAAGVFDPEAQAGHINAHIIRVLSAIDEIMLDDEIALGIDVSLDQVLPDPAEADAFHGIVSVRALAV